MVEPQTGATPPKKGRSCLLYGCLIAIVLTLLVAGLIFFMIRKGMQSAVDKFTTTTPLAVPTVSVDPATTSSAHEKYRSFTEAWSAGTPSSIELTAKELNTLIATEPELAALRGHLFVEFTGDNAELTFNVPLNALAEKLPMLSWLGADVAGRYVNGKAAGTFSLQGDEFLSNLSALSLNGSDAPFDWLTQVNEGLKQNRVIKTSDPELKKLLDKIEGAAVRNGQLVVQGKKQ